MDCRVGYQNVRGSNENAHVFLERCKEREVDFVFVGEAPAYRKGGTTTHPNYELLTKPGKGKRVIAYARKEWRGKYVVEKEGEQEVIIGVGDMILGGVYGLGKANK